MKRFFLITVTVTLLLAASLSAMAFPFDYIGLGTPEFDHWYTLEEKTSYAGGHIIFGDSTRFIGEYYKDRLTFGRYYNLGDYNILMGSSRIWNNFYLQGIKSTGELFLSPGYDYKLANGKGYIAGQLDYYLVDGESGIFGYEFRGKYRLDKDTDFTWYAFLSNVGEILDRLISLKAVRKINPDLTVGGELLSMDSYTTLTGGLTYEKNRFLVDAELSFAEGDTAIRGSALYKLNQNFMIGGEIAASGGSSTTLKAKYNAQKYDVCFSYDLDYSLATLSVQYAL